jgi:CHAT domain-containing protein/tetratricopeptide (TPR) repeat protein
MSLDSMLLVPVLVAALGAAPAAPAPASRPDTFDDEATALYRRGEWDRLLALANDRLQRAAPDDPLRADYLLTRGEAYSELHDAPAAREALDQALPLAEAAHQTLIVAKIHRHRGLVLWRFDRDLGAAEHEYDIALDEARRAGNAPETVNVLIVMANPYRDEATRDLPRAQSLYGEALAIVRREHLNGWLPILLKNIGDVYRQAGDLDQAERTLSEAMERADAAGATEQRWATRLELGMVARSRGQSAEAERRYLESLDILDVKQSSVLLEELRAGALAGSLLFANPYEEYIDFLIAQGRPEDAFLVAERERARVFLDTLSAARESVAQELPPGFAAEERGLLTRITRAQTELRSAEPDEARRAALLAEVGRSEAALEDLRLRLAAQRPALAHARYPHLSSVTALQRGVIGADEALISFWLGMRQSIAWIVTRDRLATIRLPPRAAIEPLVRAALAALRDPAGRDSHSLTALSVALHADELARAAVRPRAVIIPHGVLHDLPFEPLTDAAGRPLLERFAITYAPSASALAFLRSEPVPAAARPSVVTVANPIIRTAVTASTRPADLEHLEMLAPVPSTADEAHDIARLFGGDVAVLEGARATRAELERSGFAHARILHFATHGLIDEERPERSGLVLTADPPHDDGLLQMRQIYGLRLDAQLVTLSACDTALGQNVTGEGMIGLTRAFFFAGARSVVASLWDVEDAATAHLMEQFYGRLRAGVPIDEALRDAKLAMRRDGGITGQPFYWASFVVSGQARTPVVDGPRATAVRAGIWLALAAAAAALAVAMAVMAVRRRAPDATAPVS